MPRAPPATSARRALALACAARAAAAWTPWADTTLNVSQVATSIPEFRGVYLGSPSVLRLPDGGLVYSHDRFGSGNNVKQDAAYTLTSGDNGQTWQPAGSVEQMYWATLFSRPGDPSVYLIGSTDDGSHAISQIGVAQSNDGGRTWSKTAFLTNSTQSYSTGVTSVLIHAGRIWRAFEHNKGPVWATDFASVVISAPLNATNLLDPAAWTLSGELAFASVAGLVPAAWNRYAASVKPNYGWLEGGVVEPVGGEGDSGVNVMLRVNSQPAANKAALLYLPAPGATPAFVQWVDPFPGGMSKFTIRRDAATQLYVTLSNWIGDDSVSLQPTCGAVAAPTGPVPCCGFMTACATAPVATCMWCHCDARNNLTLSVSPDLKTWRVVHTVLQDDTGLSAYMSELNTGFQYVDFHLDNGGADIIYGVRAGYRGSNNYHNANRMLFGILSGWRSLVSV